MDVLGSKICGRESSVYHLPSTAEKHKKKHLSPKKTCPKQSQPGKIPGRCQYSLGGNSSGRSATACGGVTVAGESRSVVFLWALCVARSSKIGLSWLTLICGQKNPNEPARLNFVSVKIELSRFSSILFLQEWSFYNPLHPMLFIPDSDMLFLC